MKVSTMIWFSFSSMLVENKGSMSIVGVGPVRLKGSMSIVGVGPVRLKSVVTFSQGGVIYPAFFLFLKVKDRTLYKNRQNY
jgi:hypothetical protein